MVSMLLITTLLASIVASEGCTVGSAECGTEMDCQSVNGVGKCVLKSQPAEPIKNQGCTVGSAECGTEMDCQSVNGVGKCVFKSPPTQPSDPQQGWQCRPLLGECGTDMMCA